MVANVMKAYSSLIDASDYFVVLTGREPIALSMVLKVVVA